MTSPRSGFFTAPDPTSDSPVFVQLRDQLVDAISSGAARSGDRLPTVRALAEQLGLAPNTVAKTYRELESQGLIETRGRQGSFVTASPSGDPVIAAAERAATEFLDHCAGLGLTAERAVAVLNSVADR